MAESGAYQPPTIFTFSVVPNHADDAETITAPSRTCSVRGCPLLVEPDSTNKMCLSCRAKHRIYATTKRARRKLEKAAVQGHTITPVEQIPGSAAWMPGAMLDGKDSTKQTKKNDQQRVEISPPQPQRPVYSSHSPTPIPQPGWEPSVLDPRLFKAHSTSSELAGALTFPKQSTSSVSSTSQSTHTSTNAHQRPRNEDHDQDPITESLHSDAMDAMETAVGPRSCSVKGCRAEVPAPSEFKMCDACRDRYRGYGTKKRAKWKAEREALDQELQGLRLAEEDRRKQEGLPPLSDSPEELRAWELSIMNGKVSMSSFFADPIALHSPYSTMTDSVQNLTTYSLESPSTPTRESETSSSPPPEHTPAIAFPARMCTVSHCHTVLPSHYNFKRCEQHRLQNRYHSRLKRVREKVNRAAVPEGLEDATNACHTSPQDQNCNTEPGQRLQTHTEKEHFSTVDGYTSSHQTIRCNGQGCNNVIAACTEWRLCQTCKSMGSADRIAGEHTQQPTSNKEPDQVGMSRECDASTFFGDYDPQDNHERLTVDRFRDTYNHVQPSVSAVAVPRPASPRNESSETVGFDDSKKQTTRTSRTDFYPASSTSEPEPMTTTMARMSTNPATLSVSGSFAFIPMSIDNRGIVKSLPAAVAPLAASLVPTSLQSMSTSLRDPPLPSTHPGAANPVPQTSQQSESQQVSEPRHPAPSPLPYPYAFLAHAPHSPYPYYLPAAYAMHMVYGAAANTSSAVTYGSPQIPPYPYMFPSYVYPPAASAPTTSEVSTKRQLKRSPVNQASSSEVYDTSLSGSADNQEPSRPSGKTRRKVGAVFNHYQPDAAKRKRRKVLNLSAEQIQEMRAKIQQGKLSQANNGALLGTQTSLHADDATAIPAVDGMNTRPCGNRSCHRRIPNDVTGIMCEKCRKKHHIKTKMLKQRLKLEPKKLTRS